MKFSLGPAQLYLSPFAFVLAVILYACGLFSLAWGRSLWLLLVVVPVLAFVTHERDKHTTKEPYGGFHRTLNEIPGTHGGAPPTEWLNMGYWTPGCTFPRACEDLALKVGRAACIQAGDVLDVGFGPGDSLLLQLNNSALPRPRSLTGITSIVDQYQNALERVRSSGQSPRVPVMLYHGDAVFRSEVSSEAPHPLDPTSNNQFDSILVLDCAYHFDTREKFLGQCFARLRPGTGRIALADMCCEPGGGRLAHYTSRLWANALSVPSANLITRSQYCEQLEQIGFCDIAVEDISENVFPGFTAFLSTRGVLWKLFAGMLRQWRRSGGRFVLVTASRQLRG